MALEKENRLKRSNASEIYREANSRYVALKYSVRGRDLGSTVEQAMTAANQQVHLPPGYRQDWAGEYESQKRSQRRLLLVLPITIFAIFVILYSMFRSSKWALLILAVVATAPIGGLLALLITGTHFSVSSALVFWPFLAYRCKRESLLEYINQLRARGLPIVEAAIEGAVLHLRPIMMTTLVATLGLLPAAVLHAIGSDSQRPFAIVIVGGLMAALLMSVILLPTLYVWVAREGDKLTGAEESFES